MRTREAIKAEVSGWNDGVEHAECQALQNQSLMIELLLDIRDLLSKDTPEATPVEGDGA